MVAVEAGFHDHGKIHSRLAVAVEVEACACCALCDSPFEEEMTNRTVKEPACVEDRKVHGALEQLENHGLRGAIGQAIAGAAVGN